MRPSDFRKCKRMRAAMNVARSGNRMAARKCLLMSKPVRISEGAHFT